MHRDPVLTASQTELIKNESNVDLWSAYYNVDADHDELIERLAPSVVEEFEREHIRRGDLWMD